MKEALLGLKRKQEKVTVAEGIDVVVKEMTAGEASAYQESMVKIINGKPVPQIKDAQAKLVAMSCYEEDGTQMFGMKNIEQVKALPSSVIDILYNAAEKLNSGDSVKN